MFSICSLWRGHRYRVQGGIAGGWIERRGVSRSLRLGGTVPHGAGSVALAGRLRLPRLRPSRALRAAAGRGLFQCSRCKSQTSPTAGTIFHATKLPLRLWFAAIHLIVTAKNGVSSVELARRLGVKQPTAWAMKHKIMGVMARREGEKQLSGRVEMDDAYLGGRRSGGKRAGARPARRPSWRRSRLAPRGARASSSWHRSEASASARSRGAEHWLAPGSTVVTDGLGWLGGAR